MAWIAVVTNAGRSQLEDFAAGGTLTLDGATVGSGVVAEANLRIQTALTDEEDAASIISAKPFSGGTKFKVQVGPSASAAYTAHQIGIWAHVDNYAPALLMLAQDAEIGVSVPLKSVSPNFAFGLYLTLAVDNTEGLVVNIDETAYVTVGTMNAAIEAAKPGPAGSAKQGLVGPAPYLNNGLILAATQSVNGLMSAADKTKLDAPETIIFPTGRSLLNNAGFHNSIFRGKYLGNSLTAAQSAQIQAGTFDDLFVGDYWTINGVNWRIADFDPYYRCGDNISLGHHIAVVPDTALYHTIWNDTNTTEGGYVASKIRENIKSGINGSAEGAELKVIAAFGDSHVLSYRAIYPTSYDSSGSATAWAFTDARVELMNENEVYGTQVWSVGGKGFEVGINKRHLSLFRLAPQFLNTRAIWWLRTVKDEYNVSIVSDIGYVLNTGAQSYCGVRPLSLIA